MRRRNFALLTVASLLALLFSIGPASAQAEKRVTLKSSARDSTVRFGNTAFLKARLSGFTASERSGATVVLKESKFPYKNFRTISKSKSPGLNIPLSANPKINSRYELTVRLVDGQEFTASTKVWVDLAFQNGRISFGKRTATISRVTLVYSSLLAKRWGRVPKRQRPFYYYEMCGRGPYRLMGHTSPKTTVTSKVLKVRFPSFTFKTTCSRPTVAVHTFTMLPGYLANGDDGASKPRFTAKEHKRQLKFLGDAAIPRRAARSLFDF